MESNVAIALPDDAELARAVIARGRRIARALGAGWIAIKVDATAGDDALHDLVTASGGRLVVAEATNVAKAIVDVCGREHARLLVLGRSRRPRFLRRLFRGTTEKILRAPKSFDVIVAAGGER